ncbi:MAG: hypothetical protein ACD_37C00184G0001, partial [uncultured bacterium]
KMTLFRVAALALTIVPLTTAYGLAGAGLSALISIAVEMPIALFLFRRLFRKQ